MICDIPMQASSGSVDPKLFHMQPPAGLFKFNIGIYMYMYYNMLQIFLLF